MKRRLWRWQLAGFLLTGIAGVLLHFLYDWTNKSLVVALFSAVNESVFEHMKLLFFPTVIFSIIEYFFVKNEFANYPASITLSAISGMMTIIMLFYTYTGILGYTVDFINISIYYISLVIMLKVKYKLILSERLQGQNTAMLSILLCFLIALIFVLFTYNPPHLGLFKKP